MVTTIKNEQPENVIAICTPTKNGLLSINAHLAHTGVGSPLNTSTVRLLVEGKPVDKARNELVELAQKHKAKYLFFLDDDTLPPQYSLLRLLALLQRNPKTGKEERVASGVYYTKSVPPIPVLLKKNWPGGYTNWEFGDIFEVDYIGLGCALIDMRIFSEIDKPYFSYHKGSADPNEYQGTIGEDVYFCEKVRNAGYKIWVDAGIQCEHEDKANNMRYFHWKEAGMGAWMAQDGVVRYFPTAGSSDRPDPTASAVAGKKVCWGYDKEVPEGFEEAGITSGELLRTKYKDIEAVKIRGLIEYLPVQDAIGFLTRLVRLMKVGAWIEVVVPDTVSAVRNLTEESDERVIEGVIGAPNKPYRNLFTKKGLERTLAAAGIIKNIEINSVDGKLVFIGRK